MAGPRRSNPDFLNGVPELLVLQLLSKRAMYGYELVTAIRTESQEVFEFGEGCIYPLLHKLEKQKLLASKKEKVNGRQRVIYHTTPAGLKRFATSAEQWKQFAVTIERMLEGGTGDDLIFS